MLAEAEGLLADVLDRRTVGEQADLVETHTLAGLASERSMASASTASTPMILGLRPAPA
jgi:hypothetical protein